MPNRNYILILVTVCIIFVSVTCTFIPSETPVPTSVDQDAEVVATLVALQLTQTSFAVTPHPSSTNPNQEGTQSPLLKPSENTEENPGSIIGALSYPSEFIPSQRVMAFNINTGYYYYTETKQNQNTFRIDGLPPGDYHVVAYLNSSDSGGGPNLSAGYSQAVLCGLSAECTDHSLVDVHVNAGRDTVEINPVDWYAPPGSFPSDPVALLAAPEIAYGSVSGRLSYPSEGIPPLRVVAFNTTNGTYQYVDTKQNQTTYTIENLPPGIYHVISYVNSGDSKNYGGGYSQFVLCGLSAECNDHRLVDVYVNSGQDISGIDLLDWYAPNGSFPPNPAP